MKVVFDVQEGPQVKVRAIDFQGNEAISDGTLKRQMKATKEQWFLSWITGRGKYQEAKFEEDADHIVESYPEPWLRAGACRSARHESARRQ